MKYFLHKKPEDRAKCSSSHFAISCSRGLLSTSKLVHCVGEEREYAESIKFRRQQMFFGGIYAPLRNTNHPTQAPHFHEPASLRWGTKYFVASWKLGRQNGYPTLFMLLLSRLGKNGGPKSIYYYRPPIGKTEICRSFRNKWRRSFSLERWSLHDYALRPSDLAIHVEEKSRVKVGMGA